MEYAATFPPSVLKNRGVRRENHILTLKQRTLTVAGYYYYTIPYMVSNTGVNNNINNNFCFRFKSNAEIAKIKEE